MKIVLWSTEQFAEVDGMPVRIWEGATESGIPMFAFVARVAVKRDQDTAEFDRELRATEPPDVGIYIDGLEGLAAMREAARRNGFDV